MTSQFANNSQIIQQILNGKVDTAKVHRDTGEPIEGQFPFTFQSLAGAVATFDPIPQVSLIDGGTTITLTTAILRNCVKRVLIFKCNAFAAGTTLTLAGGAVFNQGATTVATFSNAAEASLCIAVTAPVAAAPTIPLVHVLYSRNVTFA